MQEIMPSMPSGAERSIAPALRELTKLDGGTFLYHYTNQDGLVGIFRSGEIWATDIRFLNDSTEFDLGLKFIRDALGAKPSAHPALAKAVDGAGASLNGHICIASFSLLGDDLSQWRAYGGTSGGACIGFYASVLEQLAASADGWVAQCIYGEENQRQLAADVANYLEALHATHEATADSDEKSRIWLRIVENVRVAAAVMKHKAFEPEREVRLIVTARPNQSRSGRSTVIPYRSVSLRLEPSMPPLIPRVIVGPSPSPMLALKAVEVLQVQHHINPEVWATKIPYRTW